MGVLFDSKRPAVNVRGWRDSATGHTRIGVVQRIEDFPAPHSNPQAAARFDCAFFECEGGRGQELAINPSKTALNPLFHPLDLLLVGMTDIPVGMHVAAQDGPSPKIARL